MIELFGPALDIILISVGFNVFAYGMYAYLYKKEFAKIASVDLRLSLAELFLILANYVGSGAVITIGSYEMEWWVWYIVISIPIEIIFFLGYKAYFKATWEEVVGSAN